MSKEVLITGYYFDGFHGSMMHICELAEELTKQGYNVTIATVKSISKIKKYVEKRTGAKIYLYSKTPLDICYDYVIAYHAPIITYLINKEIKFDKLILGSLSSILDLEVPNILTTMGFPITVHNNTLKKYLVDNFKIKEDKIFVFPNSVPQDYTIKKISQLTKAVIVSNHVPKELINAAKILRKRKIKVDIIGSNYKEIPVTSDLLNNYDLVISIGKTIQYALFKGIPAYCYDHFGGNGYITLTNIDKEEIHNFSGRNGFRKLSATELANEIIFGYKNTLKETYALSNIAHERYSINKNVKKLLEFMNNNPTEFNKSPEFNIYSALNNFYITEIDKLKHDINLYKNSIYIQMLFYRIINILTLGKCYKNKLKNARKLIEYATYK